MDEGMVRRMWYSNTAVRFEIVKACRFYEMQIIGEGISIRWLNVQHVGIWDIIRKSLNVEDRESNIYRSLDSYRRIPMMSFNLKIRKEQSREWNDGPRQESCIGPDFGLDLDFKEGSWKDALQEAELLMNLFNAHGVRFGFWMSGLHGFHFVIPYEDMPENLRKLSYSQIIDVYKQFAGILAERAKHLDLSIYMATRVLKCPYTLTRQNLVVLPLSAELFHELKVGGLCLDPLNVLKMGVRDRGVYLQGTKEGTKKFFETWEGWN